ncbi:hypothetical protein ACTFIW_009251 [Dictyostelium discoideum]
MSSINGIDNIKFDYEFSNSLYYRNSIFFSIIFFIVYKKSSYITENFFGELVKKAYTTLPEKKKLEWDQRVVSMIHAFLVLPFCIISAIESFKYGDIFYFQNDSLLMVLSLSSGYFIWDLIICYKDPKLVGTPMIIHAIMGLSSNIYVALPHGRPCFVPIVAILLITEISTIPLNMKGFIQVVNSKSKYYNWSLGAFVITFLLSRCIIGLPFDIYLVYGCIQRWDVFPKDKSLVFITECGIQFFLNSYWSFLLIKKLYQTYLKPIPNHKKNED